VGERWGARQRDSRGEIEAAWRGGVADFFRFTATPIRQDIKIAGIWLLIHETQQGNMATPQAVRRWIMTGSVAAVTITGSIYGATLKDDLGVKKVCYLHACKIFGGRIDASDLIVPIAAFVDQAVFTTDIHATGEETRPRSHPRRTNRTTRNRPPRLSGAETRDGIEDFAVS
jgi:hypothetical protein